MTIPQILLVRPYIHDFSAFDHYYQPVGLLKLAQMLRDNGLEVRYLDCLARPKTEAESNESSAAKVGGKYHAERIPKPVVFADIPRQYKRYGIPLAEFRAALQEANPQAILLVSGMTFWIEGLQATIAELQRCFPEVPIAIGGVYATLCPDHARSNCLGAEIFPGPLCNSFWQWLSAHLGWSLQGPSQGADIIPAWDLVPNLSYLVLSTSSGCPHRCGYCASHLLTTRYHLRALAAVRTELEYLHETYPIRHLALYDEELAYPGSKSHFLGFLRMITAANYAITWHVPNALAAEVIDAEVASLLMAAGFKQPRLSTNYVDKKLGPAGLTRESLTEFALAARALRAAGYSQENLSAYLLAGVSGQQLSGLRAATAQLRDVGITPYFSQFSPIPGTSLGDQRLQELGYRVSGDLLLTNKILSVYRHSGWTGRDYYELANELKA